MSNQEPQTNAAGGQSALTDGLGVVDPAERATDVRKGMAFEWLRGVSLSGDGVASEHAAVLMYDIARAITVLRTIDKALRDGVPAAEILDENSPIRDALREVMTPNDVFNARLHAAAQRLSGAHQ